MIRLARINVAMPGKAFELLAALKEGNEVVKKVTGLEVMTFVSMGSKVGETVSVLNYRNLAEFEETSGKLLASPEWQAFARKFEGLIVPGASHDHFLRQV